MDILIKHHEKKVLELTVKRNYVNAEMDRFWDQEEKTEFVQDIKEELVPREKALRGMKDGKLERDRLEAKLDGKSKRIQGDKAVRKPYSKIKYSEIVKRHIKEQLNNSPKSTESHKNSRSRYTRDHNKEHENKRQTRGFFEDRSRRDANRNDSRRYRESDNTNGDYKRNNWNRGGQGRGSNQRNFHHRNSRERNTFRYSNY